MSSSTFSNIASGATTGAGIGSAFGPVGTFIGGLGGAALGGFLGRKSNETPIQTTKRELIDDLLASLKGQGQFNDIFAADEETFNRSIRDPALAQFKNVIAPQIQESFVATGEERGTALDDALIRAGVDMDQLLNQFQFQQQQGAQQRQLQGITGILGADKGEFGDISGSQAALQGIAGFAAKPEFGEQLGALGKSLSQLVTDRNARKGFTGTNQQSPIIQNF